MCSNQMQWAYHSLFSPNIAFFPTWVWVLVWAVRSPNGRSPPRGQRCATSDGCATRDMLRSQTKWCRLRAWQCPCSQHEERATREVHHISRVQA